MALMSRLAFSLSLLLALAAPAFAQEAPPGGGVHAPPPDAGQSVGGEEEKDEKGPNLDIPAEVTGAARKELEQAIARWEAAFDAIKKRGPRGQRAGLDEAIEALEACRKTSGKCALPYHYLGIAYQIVGLYYGEEDALRTAVHRLKAAARLQEDFHETLVELGDAQHHVGKLKESELAYTRATKAAPKYALGFRRRAALYLEQGRFEEARADVAAALKIKPKDAGLKLLERKLKLVLDGPDWPKRYEAETKHYLVRTNVSQEFAEDLADQAELIRRLYEQIFPKGRKPKRKSPIVVFKTKQEYHANGGPPSAGGHFDPLFKQLFLFRYPKASDTRLVLYHEGFHQFLDAILDVKPPQWFNEGVADFFGPSKYVDEGGEEGMEMRTNPWRLDTVKRMIRRDQVTPFEKLMTMSQAEMYGRNAGGHYAQAWSIIYFLVRADEGAYHKYLKSYFKALRKGKDRNEAYESAFGRANMQAIEERWRAYTLRLKSQKG
jgi:tetratricopeptide (TPR) repeat protein